MRLYWQDMTQRGEQKSYQKLKDILRNHLDRKLVPKTTMLGPAMMPEQELQPMKNAGGDLLQAALERVTADSDLERASALVVVTAPGQNPTHRPRRELEERVLTEGQR